MPGIDGLETCRILKADPALKQIPVIFISALNATGDKMRAFSRGGVDFITKPFQEAEVLARVRAQIELIFLRKQLRDHSERLAELVAERTRELAEANRRLIEISGLKNDFLRMISHEIRTPANGVLGIGELMIANEGQEEYREIFEQSSQRLRDLIDDACLIGTIETSSGRESGRVGLVQALQDLSAAFPGLCIGLDDDVQPASVMVGADRTLLARSLKTMTHIAYCLGHGNPPLRIRRDGAIGTIIFRFDLASFPLTQSQAEEFFRLDSVVRSSSPAEPLGLAPVVAEKLIKACGGNLKLSLGSVHTGLLEAEMPCLECVPSSAGV